MSAPLRSAGHASYATMIWVSLGRRLSCLACCASLWAQAEAHATRVLARRTALVVEQGLRQDAERRLTLQARSAVKAINHNQLLAQQTAKLQQALRETGLEVRHTRTLMQLLLGALCCCLRLGLALLADTACCLAE